MPQTKLVTSRVVTIYRIFVIFVEKKVTPHMESLFAIIVIKN